MSKLFGPPQGTPDARRAVKQMLAETGFERLSDLDGIEQSELMQVQVMINNKEKIMMIWIIIKD